MNPVKVYDGDGDNIPKADCETGDSEYRSERAMKREWVVVSHLTNYSGMRCSGCGATVLDDFSGVCPKTGLPSIAINPPSVSETEVGTLPDSADLANLGSRNE